MSFLRRLRGSDRGDSAAAAGEPAGHARGVDDNLPDDEVERERALLRADARRLDDPLIQRQLRYADRAWTPPRQGGERRAEDEDEPSG